MHKVLPLALLAALPFSVSAQRAGFGPSHFSGRLSPSASLRNGGIIPARANFQATRDGRFGPRRNRYLFPFFDPLYADYLSTGYPVDSEPPVVIMQAPPTSVAEERFPAPAQPLMIELRGDRYVQISGNTESGAQTIEEPIAPQQTSPAPQYKITVLLFRDGHQEEVSNYTIVGGILYASADYASAGAWIRKVDLTELNVPETITSNQSRGVQFRVPQAQNEVIVGP